ncbi:MAG: AMP-binding protein [Myxococcota bacterium]|nr:AMP-binding protein [Myxococcota bacterium]
MSAAPYGSVLTRLARDAPHEVCLVHDGVEVTRVRLETAANRVARGFAALGVGAGDRVTIGLPNGVSFVVACFAAWKLGAVPAPVSSRLPAAERLEIVARARPALVVGVPDGTVPGVPSVPWSWSPDEALPDTPLPEAVPPNERALASGGSTGKPKLIVASNPAIYDPQQPSRIFHAKRAALVPGPLYHAVPFSACFQAILGGAKAVIMRRFDAETCLDQIERHRVDRMCLVPTMMLRIWRLPERQRRDLSSLEFVMSGGAPLPAWLMQAWIDWLGPDVMHEAFGPSERIGGTFITGREWLAHPGSVGRPSVGSKIRILDPETGREQPAGTLGEIYMMPAGGAGSTYHYVGAEALRTADGWESVGDMGWLDPDGYLYLGDRRSDMILCGGRNVYPAEVEAALEAHPAVRSSCVIGLPDDDLGSRVHALVELAEPVSDAELAAHVEERLVSWKRPATIERVEAPLRDDAGKVRRSALRAERIRST